MTKGLRAALLAPVATALLLLGAPAATFAAAPHQDDPQRGAHSAHSGDPDAKNDQGKDPKAGDPPKDAKAGDQKDPRAGDQKDPKAGDQKDPRAGDQKDPKAGDQKDPKADQPKDSRAPDDDAAKRTDNDAHDGWYGHYDHDHYGYHGRHNYETHRHYYRYGYAGPGWYDDCGYYGPSGYDGYYDSPDACDYQYGAQGQSLRANLSGDQEVPGPGAPNAFGTANVYVDVPGGRLCYRLGYDGINRPNMAHIHRGGPGQRGEPVIDLRPDVNGDEGCVGADPTVLHNIQDHPEAFYLNLHTPEYPDGAIRGQLFDTGRY